MITGSKLVQLTGSLVNSSGENVKDVAKRFGKTECVEELGGYTDDEDGETSPEGFKSISNITQYLSYSA